MIKLPKGRAKDLSEIVLMVIEKQFEAYKKTIPEDHNDFSKKIKWENVACLWIVENLYVFDSNKRAIEKTRYRALDCLLSLAKQTGRANLNRGFQYYLRQCLDEHIILIQKRTDEVLSEAPFSKAV